MNTEELMELALRMAGMEEVPSDTQIYVEGEEIHRVLMGIDIGEAELLLAKDQGMDCAIAHHPAGGSARVHFHRVLQRHEEMMMANGVPQRAAAEAVAELVLPPELAGHSSNYDRAPSVARLLGMAFLNLHLPLDEIGRRRMVEHMRQCGDGATVADAVTALNQIPEFQVAETSIEVRLGSLGNPLGSYVVAHGAGTNGGYPVAKAYFTHGIDTVIYIHISPPDLKKLRADKELEGRNLVVTGHIVSDSLGINPYVEALRRRGLEVTCIGGILEP